jgi:hypothetical protein
VCDSNGRSVYVVRLCTVFEAMVLMQERGGESHCLDHGGFLDLLNTVSHPVLVAEGGGTLAAGQRRAKVIMTSFKGEEEVLSC